MGLNEFIEGAVHATGNVAKGAAWVANPTHWDDIGRGVGNVAEFVAENPGKTWDMGFEVGRSILKDQLDPVNLAINAGLVGLTVATGGAAAPALLAKVGLGAKSVQAGVEGAKIADTVVDTAKAVKTSIKAIDVAGDVAKVGSEISQGAGRLASFARSAAETTRLDTALDVGKMSRYLNPIETRAGSGALRSNVAQKILSKGGEAPSLGRQVVAAAVQGTGRRGPQQLLGMSDEVYGAQRMMWRGKQMARVGGEVAGAPDRVQSAQHGVAIAADPEGAAMDYASDRMNKGMLQPSQMPMPTVSSTNMQADQVQGMDWSQVGAGGPAAGRTASYGPGQGYNNGRGFHTPNSVDWGAVVPNAQEVYA
jgi:hypothetical protein